MLLLVVVRRINRHPHLVHLSRGLRMASLEKSKIDLSNKRIKMVDTRAVVDDLKKRVMNGETVPVAKVEVESFLKRVGKDEEGLLCIDARSPCEYEKGHVLGAVNVPLLIDEHRAKVGTAFKKQGRETAVNLGFNLVQDRVQEIIELTRSEMDKANASKLAVYCARGGMRSCFLTHFLQTVLEVDAIVCDGGYKAFRNLMMNCYTRESQPEIVIVGGSTGSSKTKILLELEARGEQVLDLEGLSQHRGSAFGRVGIPQPQPSTEMFGNMLGTKWINFESSRVVYVEDEGPHVGSCNVPQELYKKMRKPLYVANVKMKDEVRVSSLVDDYVLNESCIEEIRESVMKLHKRLGPEKLKNSLDALEKKNFHEFARILLTYYDKLYNHHLYNGRDADLIVDIKLEDENAKSREELVKEFSSLIIEKSGTTKISNVNRK